MALRIHLISGNAEVDDNDRFRAETAALRFLADAGISAEAAYAEFRRQWAYLETDEAVDRGLAQDYTHLTGWAVVWIEAEAAANTALTEGWGRPDGALCSISL
jgi:hypothetical protein